jgi:hypothetical protein
MGSTRQPAALLFLSFFLNFYYKPRSWPCYDYVHLQAHTQIQLHGNHHIYSTNAGTQVQHIQNPQILQGITYYVDASTEPDTSDHNIRPAGLGIFIVKMQAQSESRNYIKDILNDTPSVVWLKQYG